MKTGLKIPMLNRAYERFRSHRNTALIAIAVIVVAFLLFWASQAANETIWGYLKVLIIPAVLGIVTWLFNRAAKKRDRDIESDRQRQAVLATYLDRMSDLLLNHDLSNKDAKSNERTVAKARTVSALRNLDGKRIAQLIQFLTESKLGGKKLLRIELPKINLKEVDLRKSDLKNAYLREANLQWADLWNAKLQRANLEKANLSGADLLRALVDVKQLSEASSLENATMPNGMKYEEWLAKGKPDWSKQQEEKEAIKRPERKKSKSQDKD